MKTQATQKETIIPEEKSEWQPRQTGQMNRPKKTRETVGSTVVFKRTNSEPKNGRKT
jgi:hypothetical protein